MYYHPLIITNLCPPIQTMTHGICFSLITWPGHLVVTVIKNPYQNIDGDTLNTLIKMTLLYGCPKRIHFMIFFVSCTEIIFFG